MATLVGPNAWTSPAVIRHCQAHRTPHARRYRPTKWCDGAQMANFWRFLHPVFSASHVRTFQTYVIRTKATICVEVQV